MTERPLNAADRMWISWFEPVEHKFPEARAARTNTNTTREEQRRIRQQARDRQRRADRLAGVQ